MTDEAAFDRWFAEHGIQSLVEGASALERLKAAFLAGAATERAERERQSEVLPDTARIEGPPVEIPRGASKMIRRSIRIPDRQF